MPGHQIGCTWFTTLFANLVPKPGASVLLQTNKVYKAAQGKSMGIDGRRMKGRVDAGGWIYSAALLGFVSKHTVSQMAAPGHALNLYCRTGLLTTTNERTQEV